MIEVTDRVSELGNYHMSSFSESKLQIIKQLETLAQTKCPRNRRKNFCRFCLFIFLKCL